MGAWELNIALLYSCCIGTLLLAFALLSRVGSWHVPQIVSLNLDEGLRIGSPAREIAAYSGSDEMHLTFGDRTTFLIFGSEGCEPCTELMRVATLHPATRHMRLVYIGDSEQIEAEPEVRRSWECYRFHDEKLCRQGWRAPVSPYHYVIDAEGYIVGKGVASRPAHLDYLLAHPPASMRSDDAMVVGLPTRAS